MGLTCCITGYRPTKLPWLDDTQSPPFLALQDALRKLIGDLAAQGYTRFISGMAMGVDLLFAALVLDAKKQFPLLTLEAAIPYPDQARSFPAVYKSQYNALRARCDCEQLISEGYTQFCMALRNRYMVEQADLVIAVFDGRPGGTANTVGYAQALQKKLYLIDPSTLQVTPE